MKNRIGIYYAYWEKNWDADFLPYVSKVKSLGFDTLEVNAGTLHRMTKSELSTLGAVAEDADIGLTSCVGLTANLDPASPEKEIRQAGVEFLKGIIDKVHLAGIDRVSGIIYGAWPGALPFGADKQGYTDRSVESLREAAKKAEDFEVTLNVEVVNRFEQFIMNTAQEAVYYIERVSSPRVKMLLDTFHINIEERDFEGPIKCAGKHLGHFHIGENDRRPPGTGKLPWKEIFDSLKEIGFQGDIVMEPFVVPGGEVGRDIRVYRDLRGEKSIDQQASEAAAFVKSFVK
jgi:D-psicose/D-tagatose/L-ribulose 3-epimerase